jgi:UDP-N-acetylglucosamine 2-epimerase (non-hydrolysing)
MKVMTILGTRPEIIRLALVIEKLDRLAEHVLVHTGQNGDPKLSDVFFEELGVRAPDHHLGITGASPGEQIGRILAASERLLHEERPDRVLILGDTNSGLAAVMAKRLGIPVYHMEAGNRCYDDRVPEEVNRRIIDHCSDVLLPYTERSRQNLLREGFHAQRVLVTGNPIFEVLEHFAERIARSRVLETLGILPGRYFAATLHRAENVDVPERLADLVSALERLHAEHDVPVIVSTHPRTRSKLDAMGIAPKGEGVRFLEPFGFFDFVWLEKNARCVLTDSGTVQEEACIFRLPSVVLRDATERLEIVEGGGSILSGTDPEAILACVRTALDQRGNWTVPREYLEPTVSSTVVKIVLGR